MKDKYGHDYDELLKVQSQQLDHWQSRLKFSLMMDLDTYCKATNLPAATPNDVHRVYRGQDLVQIIMEWPNLSPAYAPMPTKTEDGI